MAVLRSASSLPALPDSARYHEAGPDWMGQAGGLEEEDLSRVMPGAGWGRGDGASSGKRGGKAGPAYDRYF